MVTDPNPIHKEGDDCDPTSADPKAGSFDSAGRNKEGDDCDPTSSDPKAGGFESTGKPA